MKTVLVESSSLHAVTVTSDMPTVHGVVRCVETRTVCDEGATLHQYIVLSSGEQRTSCDRYWYRWDGTVEGSEGYFDVFGDLVPEKILTGAQAAPLGGRSPKQAMVAPGQTGGRRIR